MIPYHMGALLPIEQRYTNLAFRRVARRFSPKRLDYDDARVLAAFLALVPPRFARFIFHWDKIAVSHAKIIQREFTDERLVRANWEAVDMETAIAILQAMKDGGWKSGPLPDIVKSAVREAKHRGRDVSKDFGLGVDQVNAIMWPRTKRRADRARARVSLVVS